MQNLEVDLREGPGDLDVIDAVRAETGRADREVLVDGDAVRPAFDRLLDDRDAVFRVVEPHRNRLTPDEPCRVDLDPVSAELADRALHLLERAWALERVDRGVKADALRRPLVHLDALFKPDEAIDEEVV